MNHLRKKIIKEYLNIDRSLARNLRLIIENKKRNTKNLNTLINILLIPEGVSKKIVEDFGPHAIWFANLMLTQLNKYRSLYLGNIEYGEYSFNHNNNELIEEIINNFDFTKLKKSFNYAENLFKTLNPEVFDIFKSSVYLIIDDFFNYHEAYNEQIVRYIQIALNGDKSTIKNKNINQIIDLTKEWYDVNYEEPNTSEILIDYRDENGIGFYWVNLNRNSCEIETDRMNHCGAAGIAETLLSLREYRPHPADPTGGKKYKINKSHLTAAFNEKLRIITQLRGNSNSVPDKKYFNFIIDLFNLKIGNRFFINCRYAINRRIGKDYKAKQIKVLKDIDASLANKIFEIRPDLSDATD